MLDKLSEFLLTLSVTERAFPRYVWSTYLDLANLMLLLLLLLSYLVLYYFGPSSGKPCLCASTVDCFHRDIVIQHIYPCYFLPTDY